jgi:phospholipase/lecithinase/hemolysin
MIQSSRHFLFGTALLIFSAAAGLGQQAPVFTQVFVFGDSLSDDGNIHHRAEDKFSIGYPGGDFNYSDGRFTNSSDTVPGSASFAGVWHEQLARTFLLLPRASNSLDAGNDFAFGGATTKDGATDRTVFSNPDPFSGGNTTITIDNIGKQVDDYIAGHTADPAALYIVWGGGNDLFDDHTAANITATAERVAGLVTRLANAGARNFLVPNVPPLGAIPNYKDQPLKSAALNQASADYRAQLNTTLDAANSALLGQGITITLYRLDVWELFLRLIADPATFGFTNVVDNAQGKPVKADEFLFWDDIHPTTAGHFQIASAAFKVLNGSAGTPARNANISTRSPVGTGDNVLVGGFIVQGPGTKKVLVRGIGPSLAASNVPGPLADPVLSLNQGATVVATNDNWKDTQALEIAATGLPPSDDLESASLQTLAPGAYTATLSGKNGTTGVGRSDVFDIGKEADSTLANISTRGSVGTGDDVLIGGFIVGSGSAPLVLVRAIGPSLAASSVANPLLDPMLELHDANGTLLGSNDNWKDTQLSAINASALAPSDDRESAILAETPAGNYTAIVRGKDGSTGVALVEEFNLE